MANTQVTFDSIKNNARSESNIAINPNNPLQIVAASKRFVNITDYNFSLATEYSPDGGQNWHNSVALATPGFTVMTDPTLAWDDSGNVFLVGLAGTLNPPPPPPDLFQTTTGIVVYKSTDAGKTWSPPITIAGTASSGGTGGADKQWAAGDTNPASPYHGNIYAVWDNLTTGGMAFMRTQNGGATWIGAGSGASATAAGSSIATGTAYPEIDVSADGTVYVVATGADSFGDAAIIMLVSNDGGDTFQPSPTLPASGITTLSQELTPSSSGFPVFPGGTFRVLTDPTACSVGPSVYVAWADYREGISRIYYAHSIDAGNTWTTGTSGQSLLSASILSGLANYQHFHPQIVVDPNGVVGCTFYEFGPKPSTYLIDVILSQSFDKGATFNYFIVTDQAWDPTVDAPLAEGYADTTFIGDYFGLDASSGGFYPLWTDTRTGVQELFTQLFPEKGIEFVIQQSTVSQDQVDALRKTEGGDGLVKCAFSVVVDGFTAAKVGATSPSSMLGVSPTPAVAGMTIVCTGNVAARGSYGAGPQRFTFSYNLEFGSNTSDPAFSFAATSLMLTLTATVAGVSGQGQIELLKSADPYMLHGNPPWLSVDLRVFPVRTGDIFGQPMGDVTTANTFIQNVAYALAKGNGKANSQSFDDPTVLSPTEDGSALFLTPTDNSMPPKPVF